MKTQVYKTVTTHNGKYVWQRNVFGKPLRSPVHFDTPEDASVDSDLVAYYFRTVWKLELPTGMDPEHWSCLIFSRRSVALADRQSVEKALHPCVLEFVGQHRSELEAHRDSAPEDTMSDKLRSSINYNLQPEIREFCNALDKAALDERDFKQINIKHLFSLVDASSSRLREALPALRLAVKMLANATNPRLVLWTQNISALIVHIEQDIDYVSVLSANLRAESEQVSNAVKDLELHRPELT